MARLYVGTSGWNYGNWRGSFYPVGTPSKDFLSFYARRFPSAEVNYSFYHLPLESTYKNWRARTPDGFVFALKLSRFITHIKRLHEVKEPWEEFLRRAHSLEDKLGPILLQFPPSFRLSDENLDRVSTFLGYAARQRDVRLAFEFRHLSCLGQTMLAMLREHGASLVIAHSSRFPVPETIATATFVYFRFHGPKEWCASSYSEAELRQWARAMRRFMKEQRDVYAYFNNDARADAAPNAATLMKLAGGRSLEAK